MVDCIDSPGQTLTAHAASGASGAWAGRGLPGSVTDFTHLLDMGAGYRGAEQLPTART